MFVGVSGRTWTVLAAKWTQLTVLSTSNSKLNGPTRGHAGGQKKMEGMCFKGKKL